MVEPKRGQIWWVALDPTQGSEIKKTRPCIVLSRDVINQNRRTVIVVPLSSRTEATPPVSVAVVCRGKQGIAIMDQIRAVDKARLQNPIETVPTQTLEMLEEALAEILQLY